MNKLIRHAFSLVIVLSAVMCLTACESSPQRIQASAAESAGAEVDPQAIAAKQKQYDQLLQEWQTLKPGLSRLLAIEEELNLLIGQLEQLSVSLEASQNSTASHSVAKPVPVNVTYSKPVAEPIVAAPVPAPVAELAPALIAQPVTTSPVNEPVIAQAEMPASVLSPANFALQLVSITERHLLPHVWQEMREKTPQLLANMEPNFQKINVRNTDYYRLKVGGFTTRTEANQKCADLKSAGVSCLVVDYTASNFSQLNNQPGA